jgi:ketosteroid isomerase-like protein
MESQRENAPVSGALVPFEFDRIRNQDLFLRSKLSRFGAVTNFAISITTGCHRAQKENSVLNQQQSEQAIAELRAAYAAFNRGDIDAAVGMLDAQGRGVEPVEFPNGGACHGIDGAKRYLAQSRAAAAQVISEPEQLMPAGDLIVVFVHARVLPKDSDNWQDISLADVYTFRDGKVTKMRAFENRKDALQ